MFENVAPRFLPPVEHRPTLTFGHPRLHYAWSLLTLNAGAELIDRAVKRFGPGRTAYLEIQESGGARCLSYGELWARVNQFGNGLLSAGVEPGDRVMMVFGEIANAVIVQLAVWKIGAINVPCSILDSARELTFIAHDTLATCIVGDSVQSHEIEKTVNDSPSLNVVVGNTEPIGGKGNIFNRIMEGQAQTLTPYPSRPLDAASIYYTGGTTGHPKGCLHAHVEEIAIADLNNMARSVDEESVFLSHAPLGHAFGNGEKINFPMRCGGSAILIDRPTPVQMWEAIAEYGVTTLAGAATMYRMMLKSVHNSSDEYRAMSLCTALSSGEILDPSTLESWKETVGAPLRNTVGMTPMRHLFIDSNWNGTKVAPGVSVGAPMPGYEACLVGVQDGSDEPGQLAMRGPTGITYWINEHPKIRDRAAIDVVDGWSHLDDAYTRDSDGWLWFHGRLDDMIITGGRQVAPVEVEGILSSHPAAAEVAVVPGPDPVRGQVVVAFVALHDGYSPSEDMATTLQSHAKKAMAAYKYPRKIKFVDALPRDSVGKIQRRLLRETLET